MLRRLGLRGALWTPSLLDARADRSRAPRGVGVSFVALGTMMSLGLPGGAWNVSASVGAIVVVIGRHLHQRRIAGATQG